MWDAATVGEMFVARNPWGASFACQQPSTDQLALFLRQGQSSLFIGVRNPFGNYTFVDGRAGAEFTLGNFVEEDGFQFRRIDH